MHPAAVFVLLLLAGYIMARLVITSWKPRLGPKRYVMIVRHHGRDFSSATHARTRREAEPTLFQDIRRQILEAGLDPHDGTTEYRLFDRASKKASPASVIVFRPHQE